MPIDRAADATDVRAYLCAYAAAGYPPEHFAEPTCGCGGRVFRLAIDDDEGAAIRTCAACAVAHPIGDSAEYLEDASLEACECPCGADTFELTVAVASYRAADAVRWVYVGARCSQCARIGCYGDWKNEFEGVADYLAKA